MEGRERLHKHLFPFTSQPQPQEPTAFAAYQATPTQHSNHHDPEPTATPTPAPAPGSYVTSPWQRMKWTDGMVKLLIMIVYCVGDDGQNESSDHTPKKQKTSSSASASAMNLMQKKGKWKTVSRGMMEKGFYVSPQQCEDKFNDLNKRYKRVNELLGKGTACRVVENQALLDSMDHISPKAKEEARKLLNSKHLFFREMCAYHNGGSNCNSTQPNNNFQEGFDDEVKDEDDGFSEEEEEEEEEGESPELSIQSASPAASASVELMGQVSGMGSEEEKRKWLKRKEMELEEKRVGYLYRALELDKQRFKWMRYCCNKEREMEKMKLLNERRRLENDRMLLLLRKKEQELVGSGAVVIDHFQLMPMH